MWLPLIMYKRPMDDAQKKENKNTQKLIGKLKIAGLIRDP